ncbi:mitochondrial carrier domain-containing protein [Dunaliella salina]|uniref:Mitochondrial carrier domain-containing protein n=1 Tax=Dunaliella salina TaxID=3046 RepID=A0ABQ7H8K9_DUNSA|nr:mitochondrial carrier domain-containing protein [Dunaliella salina]|eukprot:KAF5843188.1 mitochondrial carrier domain-containing protein [Dunaliella salina]
MSSTTAAHEDARTSMPCTSAQQQAAAGREMVSTSPAALLLPKGVLTELLTSGVSVGAANTATNPLDVLKVRLQLERNKMPEGVRPPGMVQTGLGVVRNEGCLTALRSGLGTSLTRGFFFGGARLGLYTPIKSIITKDAKQPSLEMKVLSGSLSGGLAAAVTSPIELVKTRLQAAGQTPGAATSSTGVIRAVVKADGVTGLWKGAMPGLFRSAILTAAQCATYDEVKRGVLSATGWEDGPHTHLTSAMIAGLVTTTITNPLDVIKTRMFVGGAKYKGALSCAADVLKKEGLLGFMKGWSASYARLGPHTVIMFTTAESLRKYAGLKSL